GLEQDSKLVATEARQRVTPADLGLQQRADLSQQHVTRGMAAGVVDDLELVDVEVAQRVTRLAGLGTLQGALDAALELTAVHETGQQVVRSVVREAAVELAAL